MVNHRQDRRTGARRHKSHDPHVLVDFGLIALALPVSQDSSADRILLILTASPSHSVSCPALPFQSSASFWQGLLVGNFVPAKLSKRSGRKSSLVRRPPSHSIRKSDSVRRPSAPERPLSVSSRLEEDSDFCISSLDPSLPRIRLNVPVLLPRALGHWSSSCPDVKFSPARPAFNPGSSSGPWMATAETAALSQLGEVKFPSKNPHQISLNATPATD
jgi:hypothetical protein